MKTLIPAKLGKYEIRSKLGNGAMGVVYEGFDPFIQRTVAIKTIHKSKIDQNDSEEVFKRFRREAQAAGRLSHPKIISIYDYGEEEDMAYIAMEYVQGGELRERFDKHAQYTLREGIEIVLQLLDALSYSHGRGVVHRDIKPSNILLSDDGQVKVADFGIAKIDSSHLTHAGAVLGTPSYMSPEQIMGKAVDHRSDLYSAGVILYQFLVGEKPFNGNMISIMNQVLHIPPQTPSTLNSQIPPELDAILLKALSKSVEDRFQSAEAFISALKVVRNFLPNNAAAHSATSNKTHSTDQTTPDASPQNRDISLWQNANSLNSMAAYMQYLSEFPDGAFVELAKLRIERVKQREAAIQQHAADLRRKQQKQDEEKRAQAQKLALSKQLAQLRAQAADIENTTQLQRKQTLESQASRAKTIQVMMQKREQRIEQIVSSRKTESRARRQLTETLRQDLQAQATQTTPEESKKESK